MGNFCHLHVHSHYSLLDGLASPIELATRAGEMGQKCLALTDHGNLFGAINFYTACREQGIKPIIGLEAYVAPENRLIKQSKKGDITAYHLTLLARNSTGYKNLMRLASLGYTEGFYYKPRIDLEVLEYCKEGLICLSGCQSGLLGRLLIQENMDSALDYIEQMRKMLSDDFYLELQNTGTREQKIIQPCLEHISKHLGVPLVATNDVHYLHREDARAHDAFLCIGMGTNIYEQKRIRIIGSEMYLKSSIEMLENFPQHYLDHSVDIAHKCNVEIELGRERHIYKPETAFQELKEECDGKIKGYPEEYKYRYDYELSVIRQTKYAEYLTVAADLIKFANKKGIPIGSGRGSSAGSLICYLLGITGIDPIRYNLIFERFINKDRIEPPDIDIDVCQIRRKEIIEYLKDKYGKDRVAQIITFGTLKTKAAIKDTCRVLQLPFGVGNTISKILGEHWEGTVSEAFTIAEVSNYVGRSTRDPQQAINLVNIASKVENKLRHSSTHAAGIVISDSPLIELTPLYQRNAKLCSDILTQYDMNDIAKLGLIKFDILGLRTLTMVHEACKIIGWDPKNIPLDDKAVYIYLADAENMIGIFQYEGYGFRRFIKRLKPNCFNDLVALGALYRPGPLNCGQADTYIRRKHNKESFTNEFPDIADDTYGILLYQEQIMQVANKLAGFSMEKADILRKAIGKKDLELMARTLDEFVEGATKTCGRTKATRLAGTITTFGRYGWNKAHAVSYGLLSYQTAWLKVNFPLEFLTVLLNSEIHDNKRLEIILDEAQGAPIKKPHVNISERDYVLRNGEIYPGLLSIRGIGEKACDVIVEERDRMGHFLNEQDFRKRIPPKLVNSTVLTALQKVEAFR